MWVFTWNFMTKVGIKKTKFCEWSGSFMNMVDGNKVDGGLTQLPHLITKFHLFPRQLYSILILWQCAVNSIQIWSSMFVFFLNTILNLSPPVAVSVLRVFICFPRPPRGRNHGSGQHAAQPLLALQPHAGPRGPPRQTQEEENKHREQRAGGVRAKLQRGKTFPESWMINGRKGKIKNHDFPFCMWGYKVYERLFFRLPH